MPSEPPLGPLAWTQLVPSQRPCEQLCPVSSSAAPGRGPRFRARLAGPRVTAGRRCQPAPEAALPGRAAGLPREGQRSAGLGEAWRACHTEVCVDLSAALLCQPVDGEEILAVEI